MQRPSHHSLETGQEWNIHCQTTLASFKIPLDWQLYSPDHARFNGSAEKGLQESHYQQPPVVTTIESSWSIGSLENVGI